MASSIVRAASISFPTVKASATNGALPRSPLNSSPPSPKKPKPKPSFIVRTESNVRREIVEPITEKPCLRCIGTGQVHCPDCNGKGRTNHVDQNMLPKGEWPQWCAKCGASGSRVCTTCHGTRTKKGNVALHMNCFQTDNNPTQQQDNQTDNDDDDDDELPGMYFINLFSSKQPPPLFDSEES